MQRNLKLAGAVIVATGILSTGVGFAADKSVKTPMVKPVELSKVDIIPDGDASFFPVCAPWGGESLRINLELPDTIDGRFEGAIWGEGLNAFREGNAFQIDNVSSAEGTGFAKIIKIGPKVEGAEDVPQTSVDIKAMFRPPEQDENNESKRFGNWTISIPPLDDAAKPLIYEITPAIPMIQPVCE